MLRMLLKNDKKKGLRLKRDGKKCNECNKKSTKRKAFIYSLKKGLI